MKQPYRVLMCGDRNWDDIEKVEKAIIGLKFYCAQIEQELIIISGGAPGADTMAKLMAHKNDVHCAEVKALWATRHRGAGPQRNEAMLMLAPHQCIAFHSDITKSRGTADMVKRCERAGVPVQVVV